MYEILIPVTKNKLSFNIFYLFLNLAVIGLLSGCSWFNNPDERNEKDVDVKTNFLDLPTIEYKTIIIGDEKPLAPETKNYLEENSNLIKLMQAPPFSMNALHRRAEDDIQELKNALYSKGFFDNDSSLDINNNQKPVLITLKFNTRTRYRVGQILLESYDDEELPDLDPIKLQRIMQVHVGHFVDLGKIKESMIKLENYFRHLGYPFVQAFEPVGTVSREDKKLRLSYIIKLNGKKRIDGLEIKGLNSIDPLYIKNRILVNKDRFYDQHEKLKGTDNSIEDPFYDEKIVEKNRQRLLNTSLFSGVLIEPKQHPKKPDHVYLEIQAEETTPRTIGAGLRYATSEGIGANIFWKNDNFRGKAQKLESRIDLLSLKNRSIRVMYSVPDFIVPRQTFQQEVRMKHDKEKSYDAQRLTYVLGFERPLSIHSLGGLGIEYTFGRERKKITNMVVDPTSGKEKDLVTFTPWSSNQLFGIPLFAKFDKRNDLLNPTKGFSLTGKLTPYKGNFASSNYMIFSELQGSYYTNFGGRNKLMPDKHVMAVWGRAANIFVKSIGSVPIDKRIFSGGSASNRGYGYQLIGPINKDGRNIGAKTLVEGGVEYRHRFNQDWGGALFADVSYVMHRPRLSLDPFEQLDHESGAGKRRVNDKFYPSIGVGVTYYLSIFPIRVNIAMPLKRRIMSNGRKIDSAYQIQISLGQTLPD